jgi:hypothetical protein
MKTTLVLAAMLAGAGGAYAQDNSPAVQAPDQAVTTPVPGPAKAPPSTPERVREVKMMETILANAVGQGAAELAHQMQVTDPGSIISINQARARGVELDGYGVLFDVDVPLMNLSVVLTRKQMIEQNYRDQISTTRRAQARATTQDDHDRLQAQIDFLTRQLQMIAPRPESPVPPVAEGVQVQPVAGSVAAQTVDAPPVQPVDTRSPDEIYSDAVKSALIDAMVNHGSALVLSDDEWFVVAARDNGGVPGTFDDRSGIILRIKGSDLAAFRANKLTRDETVKKVEIREWR